MVLTEKERLREARWAADLGPRGLELRDLFDEYVERSEDPIVQAAAPAIAAWAHWRRSMMAPTPPPRRRKDLRPLLAQLHQSTAPDPGYPGQFYLSNGVLFEADGPNQFRAADPIMRQAGEPARPPGSIRVPRRRASAGGRRAIRAADRFLRLAHDRGVWFPADDVLSLYMMLIWESHMLAYADRLLEGTSPRAVVVFGMANVGPRALAHAARRVGIPSVYIPHSALLTDPTFNDLPTDFAGLRGPMEVEYFTDLVGPNDRIEVVGNTSLVVPEAPDRDPSIPPVFAPPFDEDDLRPGVEIVHAALGDSALVTPHPRADLDLLKSVIPSGWEIWTGRTYELLRRGPSVFIQNTSGVSLEALILGIPTIDLRMPPDRTITYAHIREPYVSIVSTAEDLAAAAEEARRKAENPQARRKLRDWARGWSDPTGEEAARRAAALVERAAAGPLPGPIWSGWPGPGE